MSDNTKMYTVNTKGVNNEDGETIVALYPTRNCYTMENDPITIEIDCGDVMGDRTLTIKQAKKLVKQLNKIIKLAERYGKECE